TANDARKQSLPLRIINTGKNPSENHQDAIDLFIKEGSPIYSMSRGIVVLAENNWRRDNDLSTSSVKGGNAVIVFCPEDESFYRYAHMERTKVSVGTFVGSGEEIGIVGNTGINASKPGHGEHLHLEVNRYNSNGGLMMPQNIFELKRKLETLEGQ
ncbi:MAG TPA: M23 family metallopeptidase, partial [Candidatus Paceibacterota bacterium]